MKTLEKIKMNEVIEITFEEAKEILKSEDPLFVYQFNNLHDSTVDGEQGFESVQNISYSITKVGRKGSVTPDSPVSNYKAKVGVFQITVKYDYFHPTNFCLNEPNIEKNFKIYK